MYAEGGHKVSRIWGYPGYLPQKCGELTTQASKIPFLEAISVVHRKQSCISVHINNFDNIIEPKMQTKMLSRKGFFLFQSQSKVCTIQAFKKRPQMGTLGSKGYRFCMCCNEQYVSNKLVNGTTGTFQLDCKMALPHCIRHMIAWPSLKVKVRSLVQKLKWPDSNWNHFELEIRSKDDLWWTGTDWGTLPKTVEVPIVGAAYLGRAEVEQFFFI